MPRRLWDNKDALASIEKDRTDGAKSRGETVAKLVPAPPTETISVLIDDDTRLSCSSSTSSIGSTIEEELDDEILRSQCELAIEDVSDDEDEVIAAQIKPSSSTSTAFASPVSPVPLGIPVHADEVRSHARMNLSVPYSRSREAQRKRSPAA